MQYKARILIFLFMVSFDVSAVKKSPLTVVSCAGIDKKIQQINSSLRAGYNLKKGEMLKNKLRKLKKIKYACRMKRLSTK